MGGIFRIAVPGFSYSKLTTRESYRRKTKIGLARGLVEKAQNVCCGRETEREKQREVAATYMIPTIFGRGVMAPQLA